MRAGAIKRSKPRDTVVFERPIEGPTGARLVAYSWQWRPMESVDARGEERVLRVSDWERATASADTGREIVHQFEVEQAGSTVTVSAESAVKLLGFVPETPESAGLRGLVSAAKTVARLRLQESVLRAQREAFTVVAAEVLALPLPPMPVAREAVDGRQGWWVLGDTRVYQHEPGPMTDERRQCLVEHWRDKRFRERGWKDGDAGRVLDSEIDALSARIAKAERKVEALSKALVDAAEAARAVQQRQERDGFAHGFMGSKVVAEGGAPLRVYRAGHVTEHGGFFAFDREVAEAYAEDGRPVIEAYLALCNPLELRTPEQVRDLWTTQVPLGSGAFFGGSDSAQARLRAFAEDRGHDGIIVWPSAFEGEVGYEYATGTFGEPQLIAFRADQVMHVSEGGADDVDEQVTDVAAQCAGPSKGIGG